MIQPPKDDHAVDLTFVGVKFVLSLIPEAGDPVGELFDHFFNPMEKRRKAWEEQVSVAINELQANGISFEVLQKNEAFLSFLLQATDVALKNHRQEKLDALRSAIVSVGGPQQVDDDLAFQFLGWVNDLGVTPLLLLKRIDQHVEQLTKLADLIQVHDALQQLLGHPVDRHAFRGFLQDLVSRSLVSMGSLKDFVEYDSEFRWKGAEARYLEVTPLGGQFLEFIGQGKARTV